MGNSSSQNNDPDVQRMKKIRIQVNPELEDGPIQNRGCTDILFCLFFTLFWIGTLGIGFDSLIQGDLTKVMRPVDFQGKRLSNALIPDYKLRN